MRVASSPSGWTTQGLSRPKAASTARVPREGTVLGGSCVSSGELVSGAVTQLAETNHTGSQGDVGSLLTAWQETQSLGLGSQLPLAVSPWLSCPCPSDVSACVLSHFSREWGGP